MVVSWLQGAGTEPELCPRPLTANGRLKERQSKRGRKKHTIHSQRQQAAVPLEPQNICFSHIHSCKGFNISQTVVLVITRLSLMPSLHQYTLSVTAQRRKIWVSQLIFILNMPFWKPLKMWQQFLQLLTPQLKTGKRKAIDCKRAITTTPLPTLSCIRH